MKEIKNFLNASNYLVTLFLLLISSIQSCAQTNFNEISKSKFDNINFNSVSLIELSELQATNEKLINLFQFQFTETANDPVGEAKTFESLPIQLDYFGLSPNMELSNIEIKSSEVKVLINGVENNIGGSISPLADSFANFQSFDCNCRENYKISIIKPDFHNSYVVLYFNEMTKTILSIEFVDPS